MKTRVSFGLALLMVMTARMASGAVPAALLNQSWYPRAPRLPAPTGQVIRVSTVRELYQAARDVQPGGTIMVADGNYRMTHTLYLRKNNATLRSASGNRTRVVLDFANSRHGEGIAISNCTGVTIADLTVQNVTQNGIKINSNHNVHRVTIYNVVSHNVWQRHIKGPGVPQRNGQPAYVDGCRIQYCLFYNDRPKRRGDDPYEDRHPNFGFNYVGGMDIMNARGWVISDNVVIGIRGATRECRGAIFMWHNSRDCIIERNIIIDCDTGICLGNSSRRNDREIHCIGFVVRNNFITRCPESNILADYTKDCKIVHNTVHDPKNRLGRLIRVVHANDGLLVQNNIFSGPRISVERYQGKVTLRNNLIKRVPQYFVDPKNGNLHLTEKAAEAIGRAEPLKEAAEDIDRRPRDKAPDIGADEFGTAPVAKQ